MARFEDRGANWNTASCAVRKKQSPRRAHKTSRRASVCPAFSTKFTGRSEYILEVGALFETPSAGGIEVNNGQARWRR